MSESAKLTFKGQEFEFPVITGTEQESAIDIAKLRQDSGLITIDPGYKNTGATKSAITFLDGEEGILRYRGYRIEDLAEKSTFLEVSYLLIYGELPTQAEYESFSKEITHHTLVHEDIKKSFVTIKKLLYHSYYEYQFIDVAVNMALQTFEMALKQRYEELEGKKFKKRLELLIEWFNERNYFEANHPEFLKQIRKVRNIFVHPENHSFGGTALFHWFHSVTDLINDTYDDPLLRTERFRINKEINQFIRGLTNQGAVVQLVDKRFIIYDAGVMLVNNVTDEFELFGYYKTIFPLSDERVEENERDSTLGLFKLDNYKVDQENGLFSDGFFRIESIKKEENKRKFKSWIDKFRKSKEDQMFDVVLGFQVEEEWKKHRRSEFHNV